MSNAAADDGHRLAFAEALAAKSDAELGALLRRRPDVAVPPPADFDVLANRLSSRHSVSRAAESIDSFVLSVLQALALEPATTAQLAAFCSVPADDVTRATRVAEQLGLIWRDDPGSEGRFHVVHGVRAAVGQYPLGLGRPFATLVQSVPSEALEQMRHDLDLPADQPALPALSAFFADREAVRGLLAAISADERVPLDRLAAGPPVGAVDRRLSLTPLAEARTDIERLLARGLLVPIADDTVELPREVAFALRGEHPAGVIEPVPPAVRGAQVGQEAIDAAGAAAVVDVLRLVEALLERWGAAPPVLTRAGGLPVREMRGAAKDLGVEVESIALLVQTAVAASLAGRTPGVDPAMVPTRLYDTWRDEPLAERWAVVATAWAGMDQLPGLAVYPDGTKAAALLTYEMVRPGSGELRRDILGGIGAAGAGRVAETDDLAGWLSWRSPARNVEYLIQVIEWTVTEAAHLGVTGRGGLTSAGRALIGSEYAAAARAGDEAALRAYQQEVADALTPALPTPIDYVIIQADLTAVAPGPLVGAVARDLALVADVESAGAATVYRFSEASLRRAFDAGRSALDLHQFIGGLSRGQVPQSLTYLIDDIARRYGRLRAGTAGSYLRSEDTGLLAQVVADRRTAAAGLELIAPTVAVSPLDSAEVLTVLRTAGYAPAADRAHGLRRPGGKGGVELESEAAHRVPATPARSQAAGWSTAGASLPESHVTQTVAMLRRVASLRSPTRTRQPAARPVEQLVVRDPNEVSRLLREAAVESGAVWISYVNQDGRYSERTVHPTLVSGGFLVGLDDESGERRTFAISRIQEAAEA